MNKEAYFILQNNIREAIPEDQRNKFNVQFAAREKNPTVALVLSLLFGVLGVDRFYLGQIGLGLLKLFTMGGLGVWVVIDWFRIMGVTREKNIEIASKLQAIPEAFVLSNNKPGSIKLFFIWGGSILVAILIIGMLGRLGGEGGFAKSSNNSSEQGYALSSKEWAILDIMLKNDANNFSNGEESTMGFKFPSASAINVEEAYNENQVAADQKYFQQKIFLTGTIKSINSGLGNEPYITLRGIDPFMSTQVRFNEGSIKKIVMLKKGQKLNLVCIGDGAVMGAPMFSNCEFADDYAAKNTAELKLEIISFLKGNEPAIEFVERKYRGAVILAIAIARTIPDDSPCFTDASKCIEAMEEVMLGNDKNSIQQKMHIIGAELKSLGVKVPKSAGTPNMQ